MWDIQRDHARFIYLIILDKIMDTSLSINFYYLGEHNNNIIIYTSKNYWVAFKDRGIALLALNLNLLRSDYLTHDGLEE